MKKLITKIEKDLNQLSKISAILSTKVEYKVEIDDNKFDLLMYSISFLPSVKNSIENDFTLINGLNIIFFS